MKELADKVTEVMEVYCHKLLYARKLQKKAYNQKVTSCIYAPDKKVWLNSKFLIPKWKRKLGKKLFEPFQIFHIVGKQAYKLVLPIK